MLEALPSSQWNTATAAHLMNRAGFGGSPQDIENLRLMGLNRAVSWFVDYEKIPDPTPAPDCASPDPKLLAQRQAIIRAADPDTRRELQRQQNIEDNTDIADLRYWWIRRMALGPRPFQEKMTLFWHGHFATSYEKVRMPFYLWQQNETFRQNATGRFNDLLIAVSEDPAMLRYLDGASSNKNKPNENFAREVMELFTLGEGHYSQQDVSEAARAYTGWTLDPDTQGYVWRANLHDDGVKTVLGQGGPFDGDQVLDILLARPETATFVTTKLWREFLSDTPDPAQVAPIAARFRASHYDIKVALRGIFLSDAFWDDSNRGMLVKSPAEFVVGTLREFDIGYDNTAPFAGEIRTLGENLFYPPNVKGWPGGQTWINSSTLLARKQFVEQLFRATEAAAAHHAQNGMSQNPKGAAMVRRAMARVGQGGVRFDIDTWLAQYNTTPSAKAGLSAELQLQHAVLPLAPVDAIETDSTASAYLEALLMDPAFQLK